MGLFQGGPKVARMNGAIWSIQIELANGPDTLHASSASTQEQALLLLDGYRNWLFLPSGPREVRRYVSFGSAVVAACASPAIKPV